MKKLLLGLLLFPSLAFADRLGSLNRNSDVLLSTQTSAGAITPGATFYIQNTNSLQSGSTFYVSSGTVKGKLTISMPADAVYGIDLDNFSVKNSTRSTTGVRYWGIWDDLTDDSIGGGITGFSSIIDNINPVTGTILDANLATIGVFVDIDSAHNDTVDHQDGAQIYYGGLYQINHSGTHTGLNADFLFYGSNKQILVGNTFNNAGGAYTQNTYGDYILVQDNPTLTAGTLTKNAYGEYITVTGGSAGTSAGYGVYIAQVSGSDSNYSIYDNSASRIYSNSPAGINDTNYQAMLTVTSNSGALPVLRVKGAAAHSTDYVIVTDNAGTANYFNIGSSNLVINETQLDRDTRIESDNDDDTLFVDAGRDSVGFRIQTPTSTVDVNGSFGATTTATTANLLLTERHYTVLANASGGAITLWLPSASVAPRRIYNIKKTDATTNAITIDPNGSELIENNLTLPLDEQFEAYTIQSDGTGWWVLNKASAAASVGGGVTVYPATSTILANVGIFASTLTVTNLQHDGALLYTEITSSDVITDSAYFKVDNTIKFLYSGLGVNVGGPTSGVQMYSGYFGPTGILNILGYGNTNNEGLSIDLETEANKATITSLTSISTVAFSGMKIDAQGGLNVISTQTIVAPDSVSQITMGVADLPINGGFGPQVAYPYIMGYGNVDGTSVGAFRVMGTTHSSTFATGREGDVEISLFGGNDSQRQITAIINGFGTTPTRSWGMDATGIGLNAPTTVNDNFTATSTSSFKSTTTFNTAINVSSSSFMDSRFNVYTSSNIPYPYYNMQTDFMKPTFSAINGQLDTYRTIKEFTLSVTGAVGNSGVTYIRDLDMVAMADNNALAIWIYRAGDFSVRYASITLSGFQDTEAATWMYNVKDSTGNVAEVWLAVSEEQTNQIKIIKWIPTTNPTVVWSTSTLTLSPTNMPAPSATLGQEAICFDRKRRGFHTFKQDTPFDYRFVPWDGTITPAGVELWDAETLYGALMPAMNDCDVDEVNDRIIIVGDATSAATVDQDILAVNPDTGARLDYWNNFPSGLNLNVATWAQSEGIAIYGDKMWITSEGTNAMLLEADNGSHGMANGHVSVGSTTLDTGAWFSATAASAAPVAIFRSLVAQSTTTFGVQDLNQRYIVRTSSNGYFRSAIGTTTFDGNVDSTFDVKYASASNIANTQTELFGSTVPGGSFRNTGDGIKFKAYGTISPIASNAQLIVSFGVASSSIILSVPTFTAQTTWEISGWIRRVGTSAGRSLSKGTRGADVIEPVFTEVNCNMLGNNIFRIMGQASNAGDITLIDAKIETDYGTSP